MPTSSALSAEPSVPEPWWKFGHVWLIIAGPLIVIVAGFVTLWLAISRPDPVVAEDYYRQGIEINKVDPPARVEEAFKDVSSAQQDADAAINRARAVAQQLLARAQGDASEFNDIYEEYKLAPEVTRRRLYYETMEQILSKTDKTIVESGNVMPYLPLPEIKQRAKAQPARPRALPHKDGTHRFQCRDHVRVVQFQRFDGFVSGRIKRRGFAGVQPVQCRKRPL